MKRKIHFEIPLEPVAWGRVKTGAQGHSYVPAKTRNYETAVGLFARSLHVLPALKGPLILTAQFIVAHPKRCNRAYPSVRPDLDNYMKALKDGLAGVLFEDDSQVCQYGAGTGKFYDMSGGKPRIIVTLEELE